jgi:hypothetical protein
MAIFEKITLGWRDRDYVIPADKVMMAIAVVDEIITYGELCMIAQIGRPPLAKLAQAYGAVLRFAGAKVSDEEVYEGMFTDGQLLERVAAAVNTLVVMMTPPSAVAGAKAVAAKPGNLDRAKAARPRLSKRSTGRSSAMAG